MRKYRREDGGQLQISLLTILYGAQVKFDPNINQGRASERAALAPS